MNNKIFFLTILAVVITLIIFTVGFANAQEGQEPQPLQGDGGEENLAAAAVVVNRIPIQGRLTDAAGNPLNGDYSVTFRLYDVATGGTALCASTRTVGVDDGLFSTYMSGSDCSIDGRQLYLGIQVGTDAEMTPRQAIYPVPYALSLRPGANIITDGYPALHVESTSPSGRGLRAYASATSGTNYGVVGASTSPDGYGGYFYNNAGGIGLRSWSNSTTALDHPAIFGCVADNDATCGSYRDDNPAGVMGYSQSGYGGYFVSGSSSVGGGLYGESQYMLGSGVRAKNTNEGRALLAESSSTGTSYPTLYLVQSNAGGNFVVGADFLLGARYWRVDRTGRGFFNGGVQSSGADFAEQMAVAGEETGYEPGDVLVISAHLDRAVEVSAEPFATAVIGVYSTEPGVLASAPDSDDPLGGIPVAITGIVPCKVSAENGPIQRGDLLVTAATPGHAMRAGDDPPQGTVLGKALGELHEGSGVIYILVALQ
jgi:hypothetical protein